MNLAVAASVQPCVRHHQASEIGLLLAIVVGIAGTLWWRRKADRVDSHEWDWSISSA
jgi:hypothetical protein